MEMLDAVMIAEDINEANEKTQLEAWQYLVDTGLAWQLQGWFGREATKLLKQGVIKPARRNVDDNYPRQEPPDVVNLFQSEWRK